VIDYALHPLLMFHENADDAAGYLSAVKHVIVEGGGVVNERMFEAARAAGTIDSLTDWQVTVGGKLSDDCKVMFAA
jgi:hypothetical protein